MVCPNCKSSNTRTFDSRKRKNGSVWRRRRCVECSEVWTTLESSGDIDTRMQVARECLEIAESIPTTVSVYATVKEAITATQVKMQISQLIAEKFGLLA